MRQLLLRARKTALGRELERTNSTTLHAGSRRSRLGVCLKAGCQDDVAARRCFLQWRLHGTRFCAWNLEIGSVNIRAVHKWNMWSSHCPRWAMRQLQRTYASLRGDGELRACRVVESLCLTAKKMEGRHAMDNNTGWPPMGVPKNNNVGGLDWTGAW